MRHTKLSGQVEAVVAAMRGASAYLWRVALASNPTQYVVTKQTTSSRGLLGSLIPGELYNVEACAIGAAGPSNYSAPGQVRAL